MPPLVSLIIGTQPPSQPGTMTTLFSLSRSPSWLCLSASSSRSPLACSLLLLPRSNPALRAPVPGVRALASWDRCSRRLEWDLSAQLDLQGLFTLPLAGNKPEREPGVVSKSLFSLPENYFISVACFLNFNVFDWLGRSLTAVCMWVSRIWALGPVGSKCPTEAKREAPRK